MSYQVLARKWRPQKFSELVGQEHVVTAITHALNNNRLHHAYLFTGTRGVGKTTIARIFSKSLNCLEGQSADPCGQCDVCKSIEQGNFVDLLEIDAASRTKVEDTRELLDNVQYKPTQGRFKVYLIDEVHMLSKHSFNALLKTLEEPPPHVKFLLATTDPQKLPITILSRCLQFNLKALSRDQITQQLNDILQQESIDFEPTATPLLARAAQGSMRDALSLTDQAIAQGNNNVKTAVVTDMLGLMDKQLLLKLLNAVIAKQKQQVLDLVEQLAVQAPDYRQLLSELSSLLHQIALTQWEPEACKLDTTSARAIYDMAKRLSGEHIQLLYKLVLEGIKELPLSIDGKTCLQMTLLRMTSFAPSTIGEHSVGERQEIIAHQPIEMNNADVAYESVLATESDLAIPDVESAKDLSTTPAFQDDVERQVMDAEQSELEQQKQLQAGTQATQDVAEAPLTGIAKTQALLALRQSLAHSQGDPQEKQEESEKKFVSITSLGDAEEQHQSSETAVDEAPPWASVEPEVASETAQQATLSEPLQQGNNYDKQIQAFLENGDKLTHAKQVNDWSRVIESSSLTALDKQIALNSVFKQQGNSIELLVNITQKHLVSDSSISNITQALRDQLGKDVDIVVQLGEPDRTPMHIQHDINQVRQSHAEQVVDTDPCIQSLIDVFEADIDSESIKAR